MTRVSKKLGPRMLRTLGTVVRVVVLSIIGFAISIPFVWMVGASFKPRAEVEEAHIVPREPTLDNYPVVLDRMPDPVTGQYLGLRFGRWYFNSIFVALSVTLLQVLTSSMAAYAFARMQWRGRDTVFLLYLATMMIPGVVTMIPNFQIMVSLQFLNTYRGLIIPAAFTAFGTFLLRQFMLSIPQAMDEAAKIDGAGHWRIFWDIVMPQARPGVIALAIITMLGAYQSFFWPLIMLNQEQYYPLPVGMLALDSTYGRQTELIMAATVMNVVPLILIFIIFQKYLVKGLQLGGVKG
ncbi:MAG: carbohydrate ABC transporter permease [candidate division WS1 bacterium]|jgi:ABC-type glycerol-3-phosphate transport system permease component|nr:carbohydrate ABC transporter permease [candidate division WS1 bacterium]